MNYHFPNYIALGKQYTLVQFSNSFFSYMKKLKMYDDEFQGNTHQVSLIQMVHMHFYVFALELFSRVW